jgi:hypothetical protein
LTVGALGLLTLILAPVLAPSSDQCRELKVIAPRGSIVTTARPTFRWTDVRDAPAYRIELESRTPEGGLMFAFDTQVTGSEFTPPMALTADRAAVKVRVTTGCPSDRGVQLRSQPALFVIDTTALCRTPERIEVAQGGGRVQWTETPGAIRYDVTFLTPGDATVLRHQTSELTHVDLSTSDGPLVVSVRPYCATGFGARVSTLAPAATRQSR